MPVFASPFALLGLLTIPALVAIYLLRRKYRQLHVSSLILWTEPRPPAEGGRNLERLQTPITFLLELIALAMLVLAASGPLVHSAGIARPMVVVLDDSFSMQAGGDSSPRRLAANALLAELKRQRRFSASFVLAGNEPQVLSEDVRSLSEARETLSKWNCTAPSSAIEQATTLALDLGAGRSSVLVLTDTPPAQPPQNGTVQWWSFGEPRTNVGFANAVRTQVDVHERCLLEVNNFSKTPSEVDFMAGLEGNEKPLKALHLKLEPGATHREILNLPEGSPALKATISADSLTLDDEVMLLPTVRDKLAVRLNIADEKMKALVKRALEATERTRIVENAPKLTITDSTGQADRPEGEWAMQIIAEKDAQSYTGPFITDYNHPLTEGLSFDGVVWGAGKSEGLVGTPVVSAGNIALLADMERLDGGHNIRLRLRPDLSTLQYTMNWPALIWNLVDWRIKEEYGAARPNAVTGEQVEVRVPTNSGGATIVFPSGKEEPATPSRGLITFTAGERGIYKIIAGNNAYSVSANTISPAESDLTACGNGRWGGWTADDRSGWGYRNFAWLPLLIALAALCLHQSIVMRAGKEVRL